MGRVTGAVCKATANDLFRLDSCLGDQVSSCILSTKVHQVDVPLSVCLAVGDPMPLQQILRILTRIHNAAHGAARHQSRHRQAHSHPHQVPELKVHAHLPNAWAAVPACHRLGCQGHLIVVLSTAGLWGLVNECQHMSCQMWAAPHPALHEPATRETGTLLPLRNNNRAHQEKIFKKNRIVFLMAVL